MVSRDKILDDLARFAGGAATILGEAGKQANENIRNRIDSLAQGLDLVPRADVDRLEAMLESAIAEIEKLKARVAALEGGKKAPAAKSKPTTKTKTKVQPKARGKAKPGKRK